MPVTRGDEPGEAPVVVATPSIVRPGDPTFTGPVIPAPIVPRIDTTLKGKARFDDMLNRNRPLFGSGIGGHDYNQWILSQPEDLSDPEYNQILLAAKAQAKRAEEGFGQEAANAPFGTKIRKDAKRLKPPVTPADGGTGPAEAGLNVGPSLLADEEKRLEAERHKVLTQVFKGVPTSEASLGTRQGTDPMLSRFMDINGKPLEGPQAEYAKRSGAFVYMGAKPSGIGVYTDEYVYTDDAKAALVTLGADRIKAYQTTLGMDATGVPMPGDPLDDLWQAAVKQAQNFAISGIKMSVIELFEGYVRANAGRAKRGGGGGGGGGGGFIGQNPEDVAAIDYYRAMMQILGDISGVPTPGGRG